MPLDVSEHGWTFWEKCLIVIGRVTPRSLDPSSPFRHFASSEKSSAILRVDWGGWRKRISAPRRSGVPGRQAAIDQDFVAAPSKIRRRHLISTSCRTAISSLAVASGLPGIDAWIGLTFGYATPSTVENSGMLTRVLTPANIIFKQTIFKPQTGLRPWIERRPAISWHGR